MSLTEASRFGSQAVREFAWNEFAPFAWMILAEALFLVLGLFLATPWGMATAGALATATVGPGATHYPGYFLVLPVTYSNLDVAIYSVAGSFLIPLALVRILHLGSRTRGNASAGARIRRAILPSLVIFGLAAAILILWDQAVRFAVGPFVRLIPRIGFLAPIVTWLIGVLVGLAVSTLVLYVPIVAVREAVGWGAIRQGILDGLRYFIRTYLVVLWYSLLPLAIMGTIQLGGGILVARLRPEVILWLLLSYAILSGLANYLIYGAAARIHVANVPAAP